MDVDKCISENETIPGTILEGALFDVTPIIFRFLSAKDLCRVSAVCKTWYLEVNRERERRHAVEALVLEVECLDKDFCDDYIFTRVKYLQNQWHISDVLSAAPYVLLLFFDGQLVDDYAHPSIIYHNTYRDQLHKKSHGAASFAALGVSLDYTELFGRTNLGAALSIPSTLGLEVKAFVPDDNVMFTNAYDYTLHNLAKQHAYQFVTSNHDHNCYIYFFNKGTITVDGEIEQYFLEFSHWIYKLSKPGSYTLWGAETDQITTNIGGYSTREEAWMVAIRLSGPAMNSFSIVMQTSLSIAETKDRLLNFKKGMRLRTNTVALAIVPSDRNESFEQRFAKIDVFKQVFPKIPLISVYIKNEFRQLGINSINNTNPQPVIWHTNSITYLVITTK